MLPTKTILPVALVAALLGGSVGAFVMRPSKPDASSATTAPQTATTTTDTTAKTDQLLPTNKDESTSAVESTNEEQAAYRDGFTEGFRAARENSGTQEQVESRLVTTQRSAAPATRVVYAPAARSSRQSSRSASSGRQIYYDYGEQRRERSFWSKHRDKLTVAAGTGAGAVIGGLIGGKRGAAIGALSGAGGSALYTYKLRKRDRRY